MIFAVPKPNTMQTIFSNNRIPISRTSLHTRTMDRCRRRIFDVDDSVFSNLLNCEIEKIPEAAV